MQSVSTAASRRTISPERFLREGPRRCAKNALQYDVPGRANGVSTPDVETVRWSGILCCPFHRAILAIASHWRLDPVLLRVEPSRRQAAIRLFQRDDEDSCTRLQQASIAWRVGQHGNV